jgi:hypothetical protein
MALPPRRFGAGVGAIVGGLIWSATTEKPIIANPHGMAEYINRLPGAVIGGMIGLGLGHSYRNLKRLSYELPTGLLQFDPKVML